MGFLVFLEAKLGVSVARQVDPRGERTLGVLTKMDLAGDAASEAATVLEGKVYPPESPGGGGKHRKSIQFGDFFIHFDCFSCIFHVFYGILWYFQIFLNVFHAFRWENQGYGARKSTFSGWDFKSQAVAGLHRRDVQGEFLGLLGRGAVLQRAPGLPGAREAVHGAAAGANAQQERRESYDIMVSVS